MTAVEELYLSVFCLILTSSLLSLFEVAILSCDPIKISINYDFIRKNKNKVASTIIIINNVVDVAGASLIGGMSYELFGKSQSALVFTIIFTLLLLYLSTLLPKLYASNNPQKVLDTFYYAIKGIYWLFRPFVTIVYAPVQLLFKETKEKTISLSEINSVLNLATEKNTILQSQARFISNILSLNGKTLRDTPLEAKKIETIDLLSGEKKCREIIFNGCHKRYVATKTYQGKTFPIGILLYRDMVQHFFSLNSEQYSTNGSKPVNIEKKHHAIVTLKTKDLLTLLRPCSLINENEPTLRIIDKINKNPEHFIVIVKDDGSLSSVLQADDVLKHLLRLNDIENEKPA